MFDKEELLSELNRVQTLNLLVIVEGIKDKFALEYFGISNVVILNKPLYAVVEDVVSKAKVVVLLTDLDVEGRKLYGTLFSDLQKFGVKIDSRLRDCLFKTPLKHIEGLVSFLSD